MSKFYSRKSEAKSKWSKKNRLVDRSHRDERKKTKQKRSNRRWKSLGLGR